MYGRQGQFDASRGAAQGLQNAMTTTTRAMNQGPATASFAAANLQPYQAQLQSTASYNPQNLQAADAGLDNARQGIRGGIGYNPRNLQAADAGLDNARQGMNQAIGYDPRNVSAAGAGIGAARRTLAGGQGFQAGQVGQTDLGQYMNPYQDQVIDAATRDMDRARQMTQNDIAAQATAAGAFGGSRHGLVEAENNRNFARSVADMSSQQRMAGFDNAQNMAQQDIANRMQGQQIRNASAQADAGIGMQDAARRDTINLQNVQNDLSGRQMGAQAGQALGAMNLQNASRRDQVNSQNVQNDIAGRQMGVQAGQALGAMNLQNAARRDDVASQNVQNDLQARSLSNQAASIGGSQRLQQAQNRTQNRQFNAGQRQQDRAMDLQGAGQLAGMAGQAFDQYNTVNRTMAQQGAQQQALMQQLINAGQNQYQGFVNAPQNALNLPLMAVGATPNVGTQTTTQSGGGSGLMDALGFGASLLPFLSDARAKEDIRRVGQTDDGLPIYVYRYKGGDTFHMGVMAQEVEAVRPDAVVTREDGLKAVRYDMIGA